MRKLTWPETANEWEHLASALLKANLKLARMNYVDLSAELAKMGMNYTPKNLSVKLARGRFSATFFLQVLASAGVEELAVPKQPPVLTND